MKIRFYFLMVMFIVGTVITRAQNFDWAKGMGGSGTEQGNSISTDSLGNVYVCGYFTGAADFDPGPGVTNLISAGWEDIFVVKLDSSGNLLWAKRTGGLTRDYSYALKLDSKGNVLITGSFEGTVDFDPGSGTVNLSAANCDIFVQKLSPNGNLLWAKQIGSSGFEEGMALAIDGSDNVITTGYFDSAPMDFDPGSGVYNLSSAGAWDIFVSKLDSAGNFVWAKRIGSVNNDNATCITTDSSGNIITGGIFLNTVDFNPGTGTYNLTASGTQSAFIQKMDANGNFMWAVISANDVSGVTTDITGNVYATGMLGTGTFDFDPGPGTYTLTCTGGYDFYVLKLNAASNFSWVKQLGGVYGETSCTIVSDSAGSVYVGGRFDGVGDYNPGIGIDTLSPVGGGFNDAFILKLNNTGNFVWAVSAGSTYDDNCKGLAVDANGSVYATGLFSLTADMDPGAGVFNLTSAGQNDIFVQKLSQDYCSSIALTIDSALNVGCSHQGYVSSFVTGAQSPYSFQWNTSPLTNDSVAFFNSSGIYTIMFADANNCHLQSDVVLNGPVFLSGFDLTANFVSTGFRPGVSSAIWLDGFNKGCDSVSGKLTLVLDSLVIYNSANIAPDSISGDTLTWYFSGITYDSLHISPIVDVSTSTNAAIGDSLCFKVSIYPISGDADISNNNKTYNLHVVNAFDPNIKSVYPQGSCPENYVLNNQKLTYTVQFQNTGNSNAININVLDTLDSDLDLNSVRVVAHSHPLITEVLSGNVLKFRFDNIQLPDSGADQTLSHGYVIYEVDPLPGKPDGTQIKNHTDIYFDFNPAVTTNATLNTLVSAIPNCSITTNVNTASKNSGLKIFPNPAKDFFTVENISSNSIIKICDFSGRLVMTQKSVSTKCIVNTTNLQNGIFLVEVSDGNGQKSFQRIVINK